MPSTAILSVRVSPDEKNMLQAAADEARSTVSEFMRRKALEGAEMELIERRIVTIDADQWDAFEASLSAPPRDIPALRELANRTFPWEK